MSVILVALIVAVFASLAVSVVVALVVVLVQRRHDRRPYDPDDAPSPLARAEAAAAALNAADWEEFCRWVEGRGTVPPPRTEGVTR